MAKADKTAQDGDKTTGVAPDFVVVCCKLPGGINVAVPGTDIKIKLHGSHSPYAVFGHGRTNVSRAEWEAVESYYATHPGALWLHNGVVFAEKDAESATDHARDRQEVEAGFEPVDQNNPGKYMRGLTSDMPKQ